MRHNRTAEKGVLSGLAIHPRFSLLKWHSSVKLAMHWTNMRMVEKDNIGNAYVISIDILGINHLFRECLVNFCPDVSDVTNNQNLKNPPLNYSTHQWRIFLRAEMLFNKACRFLMSVCEVIKNQILSVLVHPLTYKPLHVWSNFVQVRRACWADFPTFLLLRSIGLFSVFP